ncbi:MAG: histidine--tRNA ligase [Candidatus Saelkia tenebricola]|nr:histidine--tRNA ligase [Candidatus Saelkia tenebricola]
MEYQTVKGMRNIIGIEAEKFNFIEKTAIDMFKKYNYHYIRIPIIERAALFLRSIGETTDIVEKEMYLFTDKGKRKIALRPEGTVGVVKAYIEENFAQKFPSRKFYYTGQMFRQEKPQAARYREFAQIGCEYFGNSLVYAEIEIILLAKEIIETIGIKDIKIQINSIGCAKCRPGFVNKVADVLKNAFNTLCPDCQKRCRKNPLRALDCKIDGEKFSDLKIELCENCKDNFEKLKKGLENFNVEFDVSDKLVRGLDYYTQTVFEIICKSLGTQNAICAGGRYDNLVQELGGMPTPALGFAIGVDRLVDILMKKSTGNSFTNLSVFVAAIGSDNVLNQGFSILQKLRNSGVCADGGYFGKSLKSQMRQANALNSKYVIIIGDDEFKNNRVIVRNMENQKQNEVDVKNIVDEVTKLLL